MWLWSLFLGTCRCFGWSSATVWVSICCCGISDARRRTTAGEKCPYDSRCDTWWVECCHTNIFRFISLHLNLDKLKEIVFLRWNLLSLTWGCRTGHQFHLSNCWPVLLQNCVMKSAVFCRWNSFLPCLIKYNVISRRFKLLLLLIIMPSMLPWLELAVALWGLLLARFIRLDPLPNNNHLAEWT